MVKLWFSPGGTWNQSGSKPSHLLQRVAQLPQDAVLIEHLALEAMLVVVVDPLPHVRGEFMEGHVLLHLLVLRTFDRTIGIQPGADTSDVSNIHISQHVFAGRLRSRRSAAGLFFSHYKWITNSFAIAISRQ